MSESNSDHNKSNNTHNNVLQETEFYHFYQIDTPMWFVLLDEVQAKIQTHKPSPLSEDEIRFRQVIADIKKQLGKA